MNAAAPTTREASGIHFIGTKDPRTMSQEEFDKSSEMLYHPCAKAFTFSKQFDSNIPEYFLEGLHSQTLGQGFYTLSERKEAEARSLAKQTTTAVVVPPGGKTPPPQQGLPILIPLLPFQARMMDFRDRVDPTQNGPVPLSMAQRWFQFFTDYYHAPDRDNLPWTTTEPENRYYLYLRQIISLPTVDLRAMLGTVAVPQSPNMAIPSWSKVFANFMIREGMDGIIYNEPSSVTQGKTSPLSVFFSLAKIGTYENWKVPNASQPQRPS